MSKRENPESNAIETEDEAREPSEPLYKVEGYKITMAESEGKDSFEARVKVKTRDGETYEVSDEGSNRLESLGLALHKALDSRFSKLSNVKFDVNMATYSRDKEGNVKNRVKISIIFSKEEKNWSIERDIDVNKLLSGAPENTLIDGFGLVVSQLYKGNLTEEGEYTS